MLLRLFMPFFAITSIIGCSAAVNSVIPQPDWITTESPTSRGIFIVAHGLNNSGSVMNPIIKVLNDEGYDCLRITLVGHEGQRKKTSSDLWISQVEQAVILAKEKYPNAEINFLGFSTGAAVEIATIPQLQSTKISRIIFFAPALSMNWYTVLIRPITYLYYVGIPAFTLAPKDYRVYQWPSFGLYRAMLNSIDAALDVNPELIQKTSGLVFLSPDDEFINEQGTIDWIAENKFPWKTERVIPHAAFSGSWKHLILDERTIGSEGWEKVKESIHNFLTRSS